MVAGQATGKYVRTSAQKAGLVMDQIRGVDVGRALATLRFSRKLIARDIEKVLRSAIANAQQQDGFGGDVDKLFVTGCWANQGPGMKRVRPAPMGRAFRVVKRTAHLTVTVAERAVKTPPVAKSSGGAKASGDAKAPKAAKSPRAAKAPAAKAGAPKRARAAGAKG